MVTRARHLVLAALLATSTTVALTTPGVAADSANASRAGGVIASGVSLAANPTAPAAPKVATIWVHSTEANFTWSGANGGSAITGYVLRLATGGKVVDEKKWDARTSIWVSDLTPATAYEFRVAAVNAVGTSAYTVYRFTTPRTSTERLAGASRFETAARVSERAFPDPGVPAAFVANGLTFPDALAAAAAAGALGGPVLLTNPTALPSAVGTELSSVAPQHLFVAGGPSSVSEAVAKKSSTYATGGTFRLAGQNRFGTAEKVATLWKSADVVYLANGMDFPDALAGAAAAGYKGAPVLLTDKTRLPAETRNALARLRPTKLVVLGGTGVVSDAVVSAAKAATGVTTTATRLAGGNRFDTAVAISKATFPTAGVPVVYIASGMNFADALPGAAAAGHHDGPVLLTDGKTVPASVLAEVKRLRPAWVVVLGGTSVISDAVQSRLFAAATS